MLTQFPTEPFHRKLSRKLLALLSKLFLKKGYVCFSKDGTKFLQTGSLENQYKFFVVGEEVKDYALVCSKSNAKKLGGKCDVKKLGKNPGLEKPAYLVLWSRFGTVTKYKLGKNDWTIR